MFERSNGRPKKQQPASATCLWERAGAALQAAAKAGVAAAAAAALLVGQPGPSVADVLRFPASTDPAVFTAQKTLVEAWTIVSKAYVDSEFGGHEWEGELSQALVAAYRAPTGDAAYKEISHMLEKLGDPFTRIMPPGEYADFRVSSDGEVQGVGLLIGASDGRLLVVAPILGGPADRAGVLPGDEVVAINGDPTDGWDGDRAAKSLRGRTGSSVVVRFARRSEQVPGVAGRPEQPPRIEVHQVSLKRERLELSPVYATAVAHGGHKLGYIRLVNFGAHAAVDMEKAMDRLEAQGVEGYILDMRNNPGGLLRAGVDVARLWLDGEAAVFNVQGRDEDGRMAVTQRVVLENPAHARSAAPLAVLVNHNSASASEILAGALRDNGRLVALVGETTYGKGKIQSVFELDDGSALFVTVAKYRTPLLTEIDQVGIRPDASCALGPQAPAGMPVSSGAASTVAASLADDACMAVAEALIESRLPVLH
ncbi:hypothetical protein WJX81_006338 [Elliptochloris bilobata]|uniref:PDZ domain-containing protein n=1 Tax=Elliptochloris bilobata TaxID=381761 RepID=A0AAW1QYG5_9CHLO